MCVNLIIVPKFNKCPKNYKLIVKFKNIHNFEK